MSRKPLFGVVAVLFGVAALALAAFLLRSPLSRGLAIAQAAPVQTGSPTTRLSTIDPSTGLEPNYDDSWVRDLPNTIDGYKVLFVETPKNTACSFHPMIDLQTSNGSVESYLQQADPRAVINHVRAMKGVPTDVNVSFSGPNASTEMALTSIQKWNAAAAASGCPGQLIDYEINNLAIPVGYALFQNTDAGTYTDDNAQAVTITTPSSVGTSQNRFSAALNNVKTNGSVGTGICDKWKNFIQNGLILRPTSPFVGWTDWTYCLNAQNYSMVPHYDSTPFDFSLTYTSGVWQLCALDLTTLDYQCVLSSATTGSTLIFDRNTSVWFENQNTNLNWYSGFPATISASFAQIFRNGIGQYWSTEDRVTLHNCGASRSYPPAGAMGSTTLKNNGTGTWTLSGVPVPC